MTNEQIESMVMELGNVGIALGQVETKGENNLNCLLASIQTIRKVKNTLKEASENDNHNEPGKNV